MPFDEVDGSLLVRLFLFFFGKRPFTGGESEVPRVFIPRSSDVTFSFLAPKPHGSRNMPCRTLFQLSTFLANMATLTPLRVLGFYRVYCERVKKPSSLTVKREKVHRLLIPVALRE